MRLKHVKNAEQKINSSPHVIQDAMQYKGNFSTLFQNENPIYIEIGMGKGNFIIENAKQYPEINFIGIEKYDSVLIRGVEKMEENPLPNLFFIRMDATYIETVFEKEISRIYLNFSDPWPKDRHAKRRLTSSVFLEKYDQICKDSKHIIMKTDNRHLFAYSVQSLTNYGYKIENITMDLYGDDTSLNIPTEYEEKFHKMGMPIYRIEVKKES